MDQKNKISKKITIINFIQFKRENKTFFFLIITNSNE